MFTAEVLSNLPQQDKERCAYMVVSEAGASVYSASKLAAEEFPQFDLTLRSAVSIARRLQGRDLRGLPGQELEFGDSAVNCQ